MNSSAKYPVTRYWTPDLEIFFLGCCSMAGRQVYEVPPLNIGGSSFCIAVSYRGLDIQKVCQNGFK